MRENAFLAHQRPGAARGPRAHDGTITTGVVDEMWGTALTTVMTGEGSCRLRRGSAECVWIHVSHRTTRFEALEPIRQPVRTASTRSAATSPQV